MTLYDRQHRKIIDAIEARDGERAAAAMKEHLTSLSDNLKSSLAEGTK
jgi:DNA-binding GntR family transcriptional regulator